VLQNGFSTVDSLRFNVAQLLREPVGSSRQYEVEVDLHELAPETDEIEGVQAATEDGADNILSGPVKMMSTNAGILVKGWFRGEANVSCARCLEPVSVPLEVELEEVYKPTIDMLTGKTVVPDEEDRALWIDERHILDLTEVLRQDVLLALPLNAVCRDDCKGLCPTCGKNLNEETCDCHPEPDPRWGPLVDLLKTNGNNHDAEADAR
jgi:uncharacterized protein